MFFGLTNRQLMELAVIALKNVEQYKKDVQLLFENDSYGRALSLSILGIEEFAKGMSLFACSSDYFNQEEKKKLLSFKKITDHKWKIDLALDQTIELSLSSWAGKELERAIKSNDPTKIVNSMDVWGILMSDKRDEILSNSEEGKLLLKSLEIRKSEIFKPELLNRKKQMGFYVEPQVNPLNVTNEDVKIYFEYLVTLNTFGLRGIETMIGLLENQGLYDAHQKHLSYLREDVDKMKTEKLKRSKDQ